MKIFKDYSISPIALVLILLVLVISGVTRKNRRKTTNIGALAVSMIALGIILSPSGEWISYIFYGIGIVAAIFGVIKNKKDEGQEEKSMDK